MGAFDIPDDAGIHEAPPPSPGLAAALTPAPSSLGAAAGFVSSQGFRHDISAPPESEYDLPSSVAQEIHGEPIPEPQAPQSSMPYAPVPQSYEQTVKVAGKRPAVARKDAISYLSQYRNNDGVDLSGMEDAPLNAAYRFAQQAQREGYKMIMTSAKRGGGGRSYHDHGEAMDVRLFKLGPKGEEITMSPGDEARAGARIGREAGWASMLDERQYPTSAATGPHLHFSYANENNLLNHPSHHLLNRRSVSDPGYLATDGGKKSSAPAGDLPELAGVVAKAHGLDPEIFKRQLQAESNFNPKAVNPTSGAWGIGQFMPDTWNWLAKQKGIDPNDKSPANQIKMSALYMRDLLDQFGGNQARALAAYNAGPGYVQGLIKSGAGPGSMYKETRDYVSKILDGAGATGGGDSGESAADHVIKGTGPALTGVGAEAAIKPHLEDARTRAMAYIQSLFGFGDDSAHDPAKSKDTMHGTDFWDMAFGRSQDPMSTREVLKQTGRNFFDSSNPVGAVASTNLVVKEVAQDATFGISNPLMGWLGWGSFVEDAEKTQAARDGLLESADGSGGLRAISVAGLALPRLVAAGLSGNFLTKGLKFVPGLGQLMGGASKVASKVIPGAEYGATAVAEAEALAPGILNNPFLKRFISPLIEQGVVGGVQMGSMAASDYLWDIQKTGEAFDPSKMMHHFLNGMGTGAYMGLGVGLILPRAIGVTGTVLSRMLGGTPGHEGAAMAVLKKLDSMGFVGKTVASAGLGGMAGGLTGAAAHLTGVDQAMTGENYSAIDAVLGGAAIGTGAAALGGAAIGGVGKLINWEAVHKHMKSLPGYSAGVASASEFAGRMGKDFQKMFMGDATELMAAYQKAERGLEIDGRVADMSKLSDIGVAHYTDNANKLREQASKMTQAVTMEKQQAAGMQQALDGFDHVDPRIGQAAKAKAAAMVEAKKLEQQLLTTNPPPEGTLTAYKAAQEAVKTADAHILKDPILSEKYGQYNKIAAKYGELSNEIAAKEKGVLAAAEAFQAQAAAHEAIGEGIKNIKDQYVAKAAQWKETGFVPEIAEPTFNLHNLPANETTKAVAAAFSSELTRNIYEASARRPGTPQQYMASVAKRLTADYTRAELGGANPHAPVAAEFKRLDDIRKSLADVKRYVEGAARPDQRTTNKVIRESNIPYQHMTHTKTDNRMLAADARTIYRYGVESGLDTALVDARVKELAKEFATTDGKSLEVPTFDPAHPTVESTAWAKMALNYGETMMPLQAADAKMVAQGVREIRKRQLDLDKAGIQRDLDILSSSKEALRQSRVEDVQTYDPKTGKPEAYSKPDNPWVAGSDSISALSAPTEQLLKDTQNRSQALARAVKEAGLLPLDLHVPLDAMVAGNVNFGSRSAVEGFIVEHLDSGLKGNELSNKVEMFRSAMQIAEIRRLSKFNEIADLQAKAKGDMDTTVLNSIRMKYVNEIPTPTGKVQDPVSYILNNSDIGSFSSKDAQHMAIVNKTIVEASQTPMPHDHVYGYTTRTYVDTLVSRPRAFLAFKEGVLRPHMENMVAPLKSEYNALKTADGMKKFETQLAHAIEDPRKMEAFRKEWGPKADPLIETIYRTQSAIERMKAADPNLSTYAVSAYNMHKYQRGAGHMASLSDGSNYSATSKLLQEQMRKYDTLEKSERAVADTENMLKTRGIDPDNFLNMDPDMRGQKLANLSEPMLGGRAVTEWKDLDAKTREKWVKQGGEAAATLMLKDPLVSPLDVLSGQLTSMVKASGARQLFGGLSGTNVILDAKTGQTRPLVTLLGEHDGAGVLIKDASGKVTGTYTRASEMPGFANAVIRLADGVDYPAHKVALHPGVRKLFGDYLGSDQPKGKWGQVLENLRQVTGLARNQMLMGSIVPHLKDLIFSTSADNLNLPWKMIGMSQHGAEYAAKDVHPEALKLQAIRSGVNIKSLEQGMMAMVDSMTADFGPDFQKTIFGKGNHNLFFESVDASNPNRAEARAKLGKIGGFFSDALGGPQGLDQALNQQGLFRTIEDAQIAGHLFRVHDLLKYDESIKSIADPDMRLKAAQMVAADTTNRFAGAMPLSQVSNTWKSAVFKFGLTPQWFLTKAATLVDAIDAFSSFGQGNRKGIVEHLMGREAFSQYPPEVRGLVKTRLMKTVGGMLVSSMMGAQALQYMIDGTTTFNNPPDKWFHIHHNGAYYSNFFNEGFIKNVINLGNGTMKPFLSVGDAVDNASDIPGAFRDSFVRMIVSQATADLGHVYDTVQRNFGGQKGVSPVDKILTAGDTIAKALPLGEVFGLGDKANLTELMGLRNDLNPTEKEARMMTASQYLLRQFGVWDSKEQIDKNVRGEVAARMRDINHSHMSEIQIMLDRAKASDNVEDKMRYLRQAGVTWAEGVPVKDKELQKWHPDGIYRMSESGFQGLVGQSLNPSVAAMTGLNGAGRFQFMEDLQKAKGYEY